MNNDKVLHTLNKVGAFLVERLREELALQGHEATGDLMRSIEYRIEKKADEFGLQIYMNSYGLIVEQGVSADRIPYNRGSGRDSSMYIDALVRWIEQKGLESGDAEIKSFAFAIAEKHKKEGMSTIASRRFSKTGKRNEFLTDVINETSFDIANEINEALENDVEIFLENLIKRTEKEEEK